MEFNCDVKIVDMIMGSGKSSAAINYMNSAPDEEKFLYITPLKDEIRRIINGCSGKKFVEPSDEKFGTKLRSIKYDLSHGRNIASTHALFHLFDEETIDICRTQGYTLIMDEVTDVVEPYEISKADLNLLMEKYVYVEEGTNLLRWRIDADDYTGKFSREKQLCEMGCLGSYSGSVMVWLFPVNTFNAFKSIYILTYMFNAQIQRYYYDYYSLPYRYIYVEGDSVENYRFTEKKVSQKIFYDYASLIHICDNEKLNAIGERETDLSKSWFIRNGKPDSVVLKNLKNNIYNYIRNVRDVKGKDIIWTTFKDFRDSLTGGGYSRAFLPSNTRAINSKKDTTTIVYAINKYLNAYVKNFFVVNGVDVDEDGYATSEMLQFIWRSAIREGKEIWIYIPSRRMRYLLEKWIRENPVSIPEEN
jgi:hypothetical protein